MAFGALFFTAGGFLTGGIRLETDPHTWLYILGVAIPATAVSNMALVQAIKSIGPTLTSIFGAMEPVTAVVIGIWVFAEPFTAKGACPYGTRGRTRTAESVALHVAGAPAGTDLHRAADGAGRDGFRGGLCAVSGHGGFRADGP